MVNGEWLRVNKELYENQCEKVQKRKIISCLRYLIFSHSLCSTSQNPNTRQCFRSCTDSSRLVIRFGHQQA